MGWDRDPQKRVPEPVATRFSTFLKAEFPSEVAESFEFGLERYNPVEQRSGQNGTSGEGIVRGLRHAVGRVVRRNG